MFYKNEDGNIVLTTGKTKYVIDNPSDYKNLVIFITDPLEKDQDLLTTEDLETDRNLDEEDVRLCDKYRDFISKFLITRKNIIQSHKEEEIF